jgi:hypothetical protein
VAPKTKTIAEFGDFQTPPALAAAATKLIRGLGIKPRSIIEPTCGKGSFVAAAAKVFPRVKVIIGRDINAAHLKAARQTLSTGRHEHVRLSVGDFFSTDWNATLRSLPQPTLILGNPPWVTSCALGAINSGNLPEKSNFHGRTGIEAITGKSNFDISEWMLLRHLEWLRERAGTIAVLCKFAVARKILFAAWKQRYPVTAAHIFTIDAAAHFNASVEACFFVLETSPEGTSTTCPVYHDLQATAPRSVLGFVDGLLVSDADAYTRLKHLHGSEQHYQWRSGVKHDCSKVMEFSRTTTSYQNGFGKTIDIEQTFIYPMLKSSDIGNGRTGPRNFMLVTQRAVGEDTEHIQTLAPKTWRYLQRHADTLNARKSSIYRAKPPFSIFGVGPYSFSPWKIAISGFYKHLRFSIVGPIVGKPAVFDDTVYFLSCASEKEAIFLEQMLNSNPARQFYESLVCWSDKRPITVDLLKRLSLRNLAEHLGRSSEYVHFSRSREHPARQPDLFGHPHP